MKDSTLKWERLFEAARIAEQQARASEAMLRSALREGAPAARINALEDQTVTLWHLADKARADEEQFVRRHI